METNQQDRDRLARQQEGDRRFYIRLLAFLAITGVLGLIAIGYVVVHGTENVNGNGESLKVQAASTQSTTQAATTSSQGKDLFASTCGGCHTLNAAGTTGTVGPNLDQLMPDQATVQ